MARDSQAKSSSVAQTTIPSGSRAVNKNTPAHSAVKDINDQSRSKGIRRLPEDLEAARQEIAALRAANQELLRRSATPGRRGYRNQKRDQSTRNQGQRHSDHQQTQDKTPTSPPSSYSRTSIRVRPFYRTPSEEPSGFSSGDDFSNFDNSEGSNHRLGRHYSRHGKP